MKGPQPVFGPQGLPRRALHGVEASRRVERIAAGTMPPHTLMARAGLAVARLALAAEPHAHRIWIAAGGGNNGGDGFEAAMHLSAAGRDVHVTCAGEMSRAPFDAALSFERARAAGVSIGDAVPDNADLAIDALLGLGAARAPKDRVADLIEALNRLPCPRLAIDLPSGLAADTGTAPGAVVQATHTLALLTLKPGLFTGEGRQHAGRLWFDDLGVDEIADTPATAQLIDAELHARVRPQRGHGGHKGSFGDVIVVGGAPGMSGALALAARAALIGGAGRVYACSLDAAAPAFDAGTPEVMWRPKLWQEHPSLLDSATVVAGCGGGAAIVEALPLLLARSAHLVLDADALNAIGADAALQRLLAARSAQWLRTVITPHPLEAARLLGEASAGAVQADRIGAALKLTQRFDCTVLLKGSGTVVAAPQQLPAINPSGNARLASAGTGDVLAGWIGGLWSAAQCTAHEVAQAAAWSHGAAAEDGAAGPLAASALIERLRAF